MVRTSTTDGARSTREGIRPQAKSLLAALALFLAIGEDFASAVCEDDKATCEADSACAACLASANTVVEVDECSELYPHVWDFAHIEGFTAGFCDSSAATYCCEFGDVSTASTCMSNAALATYYQCLLDDVGCSIEDAPCYSGSGLLPASDDSSTARDWSTWDNSSSTADDPLATSLTSLPVTDDHTTAALDDDFSTAPFSECKAELATCKEEAACAACAPAILDETQDWTSECSDRYPGIFYYISEGQASSYCEANGATYCCLYDDNVAAEECLSNAAMVAYWECAMVVRGCTISEMPCYVDASKEAGATGSSDTLVDSPTPSPFPEDDVTDSHVGMTPSPTVVVESVSSSGKPSIAPTTSRSDPTQLPVGSGTSANHAFLGTVPSSTVFIFGLSFSLVGILI